MGGITSSIEGSREPLNPSDSGSVMGAVTTYGRRAVPHLFVMFELCEGPRRKDDVHCVRGSVAFQALGSARPRLTMAPWSPPMLLQHSPQATRRAHPHRL